MEVHKPDGNWRITPGQQVDFLRRMREENFPVSLSTMQAGNKITEVTDFTAASKTAIQDVLKFSGIIQH